MRILYLTFGVVLADQLSKLAVKGISISWLGLDWQGVAYGSSRPIFGDMLRLTYIENPGMAFGIDIGGKLFFSLFSIAASAGILLYLYKARNEHFLFRAALALILGGALGNLIDRVFYGVLFSEAPLFYGRVVDFIDADFFNLNLFGHQLSRWPVFNIADASVTCGVVLMLFAHRRSVEEERLAANPPSGGDVASSLVPSPDSKQLGERQQP